MQAYILRGYFESLANKSPQMVFVFGSIEKVKICYFFYSTKSSMLISTNVDKMNLLSTRSFLSMLVDINMLLLAK